MARQQRHRRPRRRELRRLLVVSEGVATEKQYVERLNQHLRGDSVAVSVKAVGVGKDPRSVVKKCAELRDKAAKAGKAFDQCVCLVDVDQHTTLNEAITSARREGIDLVASRLKFEVWLLWHVSDSRATHKTKQLDKLMDQHGLLEREKHLSPRFPIASVDRAMDTALAADPDLSPGRVGPDPSSAMPFLVRLMRGKSQTRAAPLR